MQKTRQHETEIHLPAAPEDVWRAITDAGAVQTWFASEVRIDARKDGEYAISWGPGTEAVSHIEVFEPNRHLRVVADRSSTAAGEDPASAQPVEPTIIAIDFFLESAQGETKLRLVHSGFLATAEWDNEYEATKQGWPLMLRILRYGFTVNPRFTGNQRWLFAITSQPVTEAWARFAEQFAGKVQDVVHEPTEFSAPWNEMGEGYVSAAFAERGAITAVSLMVVLFGDAVKNMDAAAAQWSSKLATLYPPLAQVAEVK